MALDTSKINLQGIGTINANAAMVSGSAPTDRFNVIVSVSAVNANWTTNGLTLSNVNTVSGQSTFLITSNPGFQISSSFFSYNPNVAEVSTLFSSIDFTNTTNNLDTNNQVLVTINWITQSITSDTNIVINNIQVQESLAGNVNHKANIIITHNGNINIDIQTNLTQEVVVNEENLYSNNLEGMLVQNETALIATVHITPDLNGGAFVDAPICSVEGPGMDGYILDTYYEYNEQVIEIYATPTLELSQDNDFEVVSINSTQYTNSFETQNLNGVATSQFSIINKDENTTQEYQELKIKIIGNNAILAGWEVWQDPYDGETGATWIPTGNILWDESSEILTLRVNDNTGVERKAVINLFSTVNGNIPLGNFCVTQTQDTFLNIYIINSVGFTGNTINLPINGGSFDIVATIEDHNSFTSSDGLVTSLPTSNSILNGHQNTNWFTFGDGTVQNNILSFVGVVANNISYGNGSREAIFTIKHPINSSITKSITVTQTKAFHPTEDTLNLYAISSPSINEDVNLNEEGIDGTNNYFTQGAEINVSEISVPASSTQTTVDAVVQADFAGAALIALPTILLRYINNDGTETTVLPGGDLNNGFNGFDEWASIQSINSIGQSNNFDYDHYAVLNIQNNESFQSNRQLVVEVYHPNQLIQDLVATDPFRSLTITQAVKTGAFFNSINTVQHSFDITSDVANEQFEFNLFISGGLAVIRLESTQTFDYANEEPTVDNNSNIVNHILEGSGSSGNTGGLITSFSQVASATSNNSTLTVNISQNTVQEYLSTNTTFKRHIFRCWPNGTVVQASQSGNNSITYTTQPTSTLIINQYALIVPESIEITGFMASLLSDGTFTPAAYSDSGQYNYTQISSIAGSLLHRGNSPNHQPTVNGGVAASINLHNGNAVSNQLSYNQSFNNNICMVIGLSTLPSYEVATINFVTHARYEADGTIINGTSTLDTNHFTSISIVTNSSGSTWSSQGDFNNYVKINLAPKASFTLSGKTVDHMRTRFDIKIGDNFQKQLLIKTKMT